MLVVKCYGKYISVEGPSSIVPLLKEKGFELVTEEAPVIEAAFSLKPKESFFDLFEGEIKLSSDQTLPLLAEILSSRIHETVSGATEGPIFLRGDAVVTPSGETILIAGNTFTGKTFLADAFARDGSSRLSQFLAVVDPDGNLLPYPSSELPRSGLPVSTVLNLNYEPGEVWDVQEQTPGAALLNLIQTTARPYEGAEILPKLAKLCEGTRLRLSGRRDSAIKTVGRILQEGFRAAGSAKKPVQ